MSSLDPAVVIRGLTIDIYIHGDHRTSLNGCCCPSVPGVHTGGAVIDSEQEFHTSSTDRFSSEWLPIQ